MRPYGERAAEANAAPASAPAVPVAREALAKIRGAAPSPTPRPEGAKDGDDGDDGEE